MITIGFKEKEKGWVSFFSYYPESFLRLGGSCFVTHKGNLWMQNDKNNPVTNTFFGTKYPSKINTVFNDVHTEDKIFKTFSIEGSSPWDVSIKTNLTETTLSKEDFNKRESRYFAYLRGNEKEGDFNGNSQGVGVCRSFYEDVLLFDSVSSLVNIGDKLYRINGDSYEHVGEVLDKGKDYIKIDNHIEGVVVGAFFFSVKNDRADGGDIRGYYADIEMINNDDKQVELFAINSNIIKSYV